MIFILMVSKFPADNDTDKFEELNQNVSVNMSEVDDENGQTGGGSIQNAKRSQIGTRPNGSNRNAIGKQGEHGVPH